MTTERQFCQSCGMPLDNHEDIATNKDGSPNSDYCKYCFADGAFTAPEMTMDEMIAWNLEFNEKNGFPFGPREQAKKMMEGWFPTMKRWK